MPTLNIGSRSDDWRARRLSNFPPDPFTLDSENMTSVEGFIQGTKFPEGHPYRQQAFQTFGVKAKRIGKSAERKFVWWKGKAIIYGSTEHHQLIERAIRAKFEQNEDSLRALLATEGMVLTHDLGRPDSPRTSLPSKIFCDILTRIREETIQARK